MLVQRWVLVAATAAVVGCTATPPAPFLAPAAAPPPPSYVMRPGEGAGVARWQQFCEQASNVSQASWLASSRGAEGWELVSMYGGVMCFKRPVPSVDPLPPGPPEMVGARTYTPALAATGTVPSIIDPGF